MRNFLAILLFFNFSCIQAQPIINTFSPSSGPIGTIVTINGSNFDPLPTNNVVFFGATKAVVSSGSTTSLVVAVPLGTTYQFISVTNLTDNLVGSSLLPFVVTTACGGTITSSSLAPKIDSIAGGDPNSCAMGDLDGDGKIDMVVLNNLSLSVSIYMNNHTGNEISFAPKVNLVTGANPSYVIIGEIDGDGKPDIIVSNRSSNTFSVFINASISGTIAFIPKIDFATGNQPISLVLGDFDSDGKQDIVSMNAVGSISAIKNLSSLGAVNFAAPVNFTTGTTPKGITIGDFNVDQKLDVAVTSYSPAILSIYINSSSGTPSFAPRQDFVTSANSSSVAAADFNNDGIIDLATIGAGSGSLLSVFENVSSGGILSLAPRVNFVFASSAINMTCGDLDGDGKVDLAITNGSNKLSLIRNGSVGGSISFGWKVDFTSGFTPVQASLADLNEDNKMDIACVNINSNTVSLYKSLIGVPLMTSTSSATSCEGVALSIPLTATTPSTFNWIASDNTNTSGESTVLQNSDTIDDVINVVGSIIQNVSYSVTPISSIGCGVGLPQAVVASMLPDAIVTSPSNLIINSCGNLNTLLSSNIPSSYSWLASDNPNVFGESLVAQNDSILNDIISNSSSGSETITYTITPTSDDGCPGTPQILTVNVHSGDTIITFSPVSGPVGTTVTLIGNNFNPVFSNNVAYFGAVKANVTGGTTTLLTVSAPAGADFQYVSVTDTVSKITMYALVPFVVTSCGGSINATTYSPRVAISTGFRPENIAVGDLDGDGKAEILIANHNFSPTSFFSILHNASTPGTISFPSRQIIISGNPSPGGFSLGDLDGDGKRDIVYANENGLSITLKRNISIPGTLLFEPNQFLDVGIEPGITLIANFDTDGKPDIAVLHESPGNHLTIFKNKCLSGGTLSFESPISIPTYDASLDMCSGDIDGDQMEDIITVSYNVDSISVYRNTSSCGGISFASRLSFKTGFNPKSIAIGDFDGDGKPDLVVSYEPGYVSVYRNTSTPGFISFASRVDYAVAGGFYNQLSVGDIDGDSKLDIVATNYPLHSVSVVKNNSVSGLLSFDTQVEYLVGSDPTHVALGDLDGDGRLDIVTPNYNIDSVSILRNNFCLSTEISETEQNDFAIEIYPNPFSDEAIVVFEKLQENTLLRIVDVLGKEIKSYTLLGTNSLKINKDQLRSGVYFIQVVNNKNETKYKKIIIN